ncbi:GHKL domain-containing protein, partial [Candidatus Gracilibacteria bacterium]|nr:GHKL domain-containing protein [Candidatus Gracilibacteria bacterium]
GLKFGINKFCTLPVSYEDKSYGMIILGLSNNKEFPDDEEKEILKIFTTNFAVYCYNKELEDEMMESNRLDTLLKIASSIVHEVRTPLAAIKGFAGIVMNKINSFSAVYLAEKENDGEISEFIRKIKGYNKIILNETERIDGMAIDLLEYSGKDDYKYKFEKLNLKKIIDEVIDKKLKELEINDIKLDINIADNTEIIADKEKILKLFGNIIKNSLENVDVLKEIKYISIKASQDKISKKTEIIFTDNGYGIDKEMMKKIFEPLVTTKIQGTGLGLTIAQDIIKKHKGDIKIFSEKEKFTEVSITI